MIESRKNVGGKCTLNSFRSHVRNAVLVEPYINSFARTACDVFKMNETCGEPIPLFFCTNSFPKMIFWSNNHVLLETRKSASPYAGHRMWHRILRRHDTAIQ